MAIYVSTEMLQPERAELARYYAGEFVPEPPRELTPTEQLARELHDGAISFGEALDLLMQAEIAANRGRNFDFDAAENRLVNELLDAATRADFESEVEAGRGTIGQVRPDLSPAFATRLGIDQRQPLTLNELANLLNGRRVDGEEIEGRRRRSATMSIADVFGLDPKTAPGDEATRNILAGLRVDGKAPTNAKGEELSEERVAGVRRRWLTAMGVPSHRQPNAEEIAHLTAGKMANSANVNTSDYRRAMNATRERVAYIDLTFSADKSLTIAWALAPTEGERAILLQVHKDAVADAMKHVEHELGLARRGDGGKDGVEPGELAWISFQHYTSRPTVEIARKDSEGRSYTEFQDVPLRVGDPQLHTHVMLLTTVQTESGRLGSIDLDRLDGAVKEFGAVYHAFVARHARAHGVDVFLDERTGAARLAGVPNSVRDLFSKRARESENAARAWAAEQGLDWDALTPERRVALLKTAAAEMRQAKDKRERAEGIVSDFKVWREEAKAALSYQHRSVLRPDEVKPELGREQRIELAYEVTQGLIEKEFGRRAKLDSRDLREIAARGLIAAGIDNPAQDIAAVTRTYRERGVRQHGQQTALIWGRDVPVRGKQRWSVTTDLHAEQEDELIALTKKAGQDRSAALRPEQIERAAVAFLDRNPGIDRNSAQWKTQRDMMERLGNGGRLAVGIGAAGAGKSTVLRPLVDAWRERGREVYGASLAWRHSGRLARGAGIDPGNAAAMDPFLRRAQRGEYELDAQSVVVVDEIALIGKRQLLDLLRLQERHGFQIVAVGDDKQCQSIEAGPVVDLLRRGLGDGMIPEISTTIRQKEQREREITELLRDGRVAEALEMKREDGTAELVAGGRTATVQRLAELWDQRIAAHGGDLSRVSISAPTNEDAREIGRAIRERLQQSGRLGADQHTIKATDRNSGEVYDLALAPGDRVRLFDRVRAADPGGRVLGSNGDVVEVLAVADRGMRVRNADGHEGTILWAKIRDTKDAPVRLTYGNATTIDTAQGMTSTEHIHAMPSGSRAVPAGKNYTAASRHERVTWMVIDESSERQEIARRIPLGESRPIREIDVWTNIAVNLSRQTEKATALDFLSKASDVQRGGLRGLQVAGERDERRKAAGIDAAEIRRRHQVRRLSLSQSVERMAEYARELPDLMAQRAQELAQSLRRRLELGR